MKDPLFVQDQEVEARIDNGYPNVMRNGKNRWQMWYGTCLEPNSCGAVSLVPSTDGLTWEKPDLNIFEFKGSKKNNIVLKGGGLGMYFDLHETNASRRYKMSGGAPEACFDDGTSVSGTAMSPDGLTNWNNIEAFNLPNLGELTVIRIFSMMT